MNTTKIGASGVALRTVVAAVAVLVVLCGGCGLEGGLFPPGGSTTSRTKLEACEFADGTCERITVAECEAQGGVAQGAGTFCDAAEPNDSFVDAIELRFDDSGMAKIGGAISPRTDLDVFNIGPLERGDRVVIDLDKLTSSLDMAVAVFDDQLRLVYNNDDRGGSTDRWSDSYADWIVRHGGDPYYVAISAAPGAYPSMTTGLFEAEISVSSHYQVPEPKEQILLLDFAGGTVDSPALGLRSIEAFSAGAISQIYEGETERLKELIVEEVADNYSRFNVTVMTSDDPALPADADYSTVYFGGYKFALFGQASAVDLYNEDYCDDAIVYTESFEPLAFTSPPTIEGLAIAIGNVAAHEAGHLLGLNHVDDDLALMDDSSPADALMDDQEFKAAPLSPDIMPIGEQDAVMLLEEIVGKK